MKILIDTSVDGERELRGARDMLNTLLAQMNGNDTSHEQNSNDQNTSTFDTDSEQRTQDNSRDDFTDFQLFTYD